MREGMGVAEEEMRVGASKERGGVCGMGEAARENAFGTPTLLESFQISERNQWRRH